MLKLVFMLIKLLRRSDADVVNKDVTKHVLCWDCEVCEEEEKEEEKDCEVCREGCKVCREEEKEEEDCRVCEEEEWCWNAAINEVKRPRIALRSLKECEKIRVNDSADNNVM